MTIDELIPSITPLSRADKIRLAQILLQQMEHEIAPLKPSPQLADERFDPQRFYGIAHQTRHEIDQYLATARDGWNYRID